MKVLFATAELAPLVRVGGLSYAAAGLVRQLAAEGVDVTVVLPDYGTYEAGLGADEPLDMPGWVGITTIRRGSLADGVPLVAVRTPAIERPHPYNDAGGQGWHDNDFRFMAFSAAVARLVDELGPDVLHVNDWHTGATLGMLSRHVPSVFTIHNLAYQGMADGGWVGVLGRRPEAYEWHGTVNPMSGAIALADRRGGGQPQLRPRDPPPRRRLRARRPAACPRRRPRRHPQRHRHRTSGTRPPTRTSPLPSTPTT